MIAYKQGSVLHSLIRRRDRVVSAAQMSTACSIFSLDRVANNDRTIFALRTNPQPCRPSVQYRTIRVVRETTFRAIFEQSAPQRINARRRLQQACLRLMCDSVADTLVGIG